MIGQKPFKELQQSDPIRFVEMARSAVYYDQIYETWQECRDDLNMKGNSFCLYDVDEVKTTEVEKILTDIIIKRYPASSLLKTFIYRASEEARCKIQKVIDSVPKEETFKTLHFEGFTFEELEYSALNWSNKRALIPCSELSDDNEKLIRENFLINMICWLRENANSQQIIRLAEKAPNNLRGEFLLGITWIALLEREETLTNTDKIRLVNVFCGKPVRFFNVHWRDNKWIKASQVKERLQQIIKNELTPERGTA